MAEKKKAERYEMFVADGTAFDEATSTLIKHLRRGETVQALYWAHQFEERYRKYLWRRLAIFAAEDVSIANPFAIAHVVAAWRALDVWRVEASDRTIVMLSESVKCRESNLLWAAVGEAEKLGHQFLNSGMSVEMWRNALATAMRNGDELEAAWCARNAHQWGGAVDVWEPIIEVAWERQHQHGLMATVMACQEAYAKIAKLAKRPDLDVVSMAVLTVCRSGGRSLDLELEKAQGPFEVPEYALDGHTRRGKMMNPVSDVRHRRWFMEWSQVSPNIGPNDVELWHLRRIAARGLVDPEEIEQTAEDWFEEGRLVHGLEGTFPKPWQS